MATWRHLPAGYFRDTATIYTENATTGAFDVVARTGLACRLVAVDRQAGATGPDRADLAALREMHSDPTYSIPPYSHLLIDGRTWTPNPRTSLLEKHHNGDGIFWRSDLVESAS